MHWWPGDIGWKTSSTCRKHLSFLPCYIYPNFAVGKFMYGNFRAVTTWKKNFCYANSYEWVTDVWSLFSNIEVWHFNLEPIVEVSIALQMSRGLPLCLDKRNAIKKTKYLRYQLFRWSIIDTFARTTLLRTDAIGLRYMHFKHFNWLKKITKE